MDGIYTYAEAAKVMGLSKKTVKLFASPSRPANKRLRVIRLGYHTVRIRSIDIAEFYHRNRV